MRMIDTPHLHSRWAKLVRGLSTMQGNTELHSMWLHVGQLDCKSYPTLGCSDFFLGFW